jgi:hypothetical protein
MNIDDMKKLVGLIRQLEKIQINSNLIQNLID